MLLRSAYRNLGRWLASQAQIGSASSRHGAVVSGALQLQVEAAALQPGGPAWSWPVRLRKAAWLAGTAAMAVPVATAQEAAPQPSQAAPEQAAPAGNASTAQWRIYTDVGRELVTQGRLDEAEVYLRRALREARAGFGEADPHAASAANNLAEFLRLRRRWAEALPLYQQAADILEAAYGAHDVRLGALLHNMAGLFLQQQDLPRARDCYLRSLTIKQAALGARHPEVAESLQHLAAVAWRQADKAAALALMQQALDILDENGQGSSPGAMRAVARLADALLAAERPADAEPLLRRALQHAQDSQGPTSMAAAHAEGRLALALARAGKLPAAQQLLQESLDLRRAKLGASDTRLTVTLRQLAELHLQQGTLASLTKARSCAQQAYDLAEPVWLAAHKSPSGTGRLRAAWNALLHPEGSQLQEAAAVAVDLAKSLRLLAAISRQLNPDKAEAAAHLRQAIDLLQSAAATGLAEGSSAKQGQASSTSGQAVRAAALQAARQLELAACTAALDQLQGITP